MISSSRNNSLPQANAAPVPYGALAFLLATGIILVFLAHHPVVGAALTGKEGLGRMIQLGSQDEAVHAFICVAVAGLLYGAIELNIALGRSRASTEFGLASYAAGCAFLIVAMLLDGFVTPMLAERLSQEGAVTIEAAGPLWLAISACIQVLTKAGLCGTGVGMVLLSAACWKRPGGRLVAALGPIAGLLPPLATILMGARLNPHLLVLLAAAQGCWNVAAAAFLWTGRGGARQAADWGA